MLMSKFQQAIVFGGLLTAAITLNAFAFDLKEVKNGDQPYLDGFNALDKDQSQTLSWAEAQADSGLKHQDFNAFDANKDGSLSYQEYAELKTSAGQEIFKAAMSDSWITTKVKARLLEEEALKSLKISVETHQGDVLISGFVSDVTLKSRAEQLVASVEGVKSVKNAIVVKEG
ncbi:hyperosmotically inducible protein [Methylophilus rhizosphaerae]|uniref:Hyperosmotically inducible protein n=2 Tax=Methylophilus rhizosphaerae TaxID=492660 RepID=A0A1G9BTK5_9PROT|nr:hyperosmotically inducible protein [Methylophilus rhizosphaerae]